MMNSMEFDVFKSKEAYDKDEFYVKLCKGAKRAIAFKEMFMDKQPKYMRTISPK